MARPSICVVGTGYVGMATMIGLAQLGYGVRGYDILGDRIERLQRGIPPYREAGIEALLREHLAAGRLSFFAELADAACDAELIVIAVGTPTRDDGSADLSGLHDAIEQLVAVPFEGWPTVAVRSTVPPGTCDRLATVVEEFGELIYAPEFLREGSAVADFLSPDRIVVGARSPAAAVPYVRLFETLEKPVVLTSRTNAELIKCCSNAFLALKISFANEVANLCDVLGATSDDVLRGVGYDRRIGTQFLRPGIGFGGPCFEKDVRSIVHVASTHDVGRELFSATLRVNATQPRRIVEMIERDLGRLAGRTLGIWGLAFKAGTDDVRDSLALRIVRELGERGATMLAYDPAVRLAPLPAGCRLVADPLAACDADALLVLTEWPQFRAVDPSEVAERLRLGVVVDGRNILDPARYEAAGLLYRGVGRPRRTRIEEPAAMMSVL